MPRFCAPATTAAVWWIRYCYCGYGRPVHTWTVRVLTVICYNLMMTTIQGDVTAAAAGRDIFSVKRFQSSICCWASSALFNTTFSVVHGLRCLLCDLVGGGGGTSSIQWLCVVRRARYAVVCIAAKTAARHIAAAYKLKLLTKGGTKCLLRTSYVRVAFLLKRMRASQVQTACANKRYASPHSPNQSSPARGWQNGLAGWEERKLLRSSFWQIIITCALYYLLQSGVKTFWKKPPSKPPAPPAKNLVVGCNTYTR